MKILVVEPRKHPRVMEIPNTLRDKQAVVDGLIQPVELDDGAIIICNEEGLFRPDLEWNRKLYEPFELAIKGTFFLCCGNEDGDFISLTDDLIDKYNIREIAYDRWNASMMVQTLQDDGFTMIPFGQGFKDMSPPTKELMRIVLEHKLNHGGNPILRWNMDNAFVRTDPAGNIKLDKEKSTEKIDGAVALVMALDRAMKNLGSGSIYDVRDMLTLDW